jgi:hypothetical protein
VAEYLKAKYKEVSGGRITSLFLKLFVAAKWCREGKQGTFTPLKEKDGKLSAKTLRIAKAHFLTNDDF